MNKKEISVIVKYFHPVTAGIETNVLKTYKELTTKWAVTIHTSTDTHVGKDVLKNEDQIQGLPVKRYYFGRTGFWPVTAFDSEIVALHNFDIFPHFQILLYTLLLKALGKKKYKLVLTPHGGFTPEWKIFPIYQRIIKQIYHHTLAVLLVNITVDAVRAVSIWERNEMEKYGIKKNLLSVISNGVEDEAYEKNNQGISKEYMQKVSAFGKYILQVGRIYKIKNYETVIRALVNIPSDVNYVIVGEPEKNDSYKKSLIKLSEELGVAGRVIFTGVIKGKEKYYLMRHAKLMVHMAIWESFCNVVNEGMSQGLVCVVANNSALPFIVKDNINGYICPTHNSECVAKKINFIFKNYQTEKIKKIQKTNESLGLTMSWKNVAFKMERMYEEVLK